MDASFYSAVLGIVIGSVITFLVAHGYYEVAGKELQEETRKLRELLRVVLTALESHGLATLNRDSEGNITGYNHIAAPLTGGLSFGGALSTTHIPAAKKEP